MCCHAWTTAVQLLQAFPHTCGYLDTCNQTPAGIPRHLLDLILKYLFDRLQLVLNEAARCLICRARKYNHVSVEQLDWLSVPERIKYHLAVHGTN